MRFWPWSQSHTGPPADANGAARTPPSSVERIEAERGERVRVETARRAQALTDAQASGARTCATCRYAEHLTPAPRRRTKARYLEYVGIDHVPVTEAPFWEDGMGPEVECRRSIPPTWQTVRLADWCGEWAPLGARPRADDEIGAVTGLPDSGLTKPGRTR